MDALRAKLQALGIDLNSAANGVWLPGPNAAVDAPEAYHRSLNNPTYLAAVAFELRNANTRQGVISVLTDIADRLRSGDFPGVRPNPRSGAGG